MMAQVIEHESHAYDASKMWLYLDSKSRFVASASWREWRDNPGGAKRLETVRLLAAESDCRDTLRKWCKAQQDAGAACWNINETWPIDEKHAPKGHRLHGKRENGTRESWTAPYRMN